MDSANIHHLHLQLQDQLASSSSSSSSSSSATPFLHGISTTQSSTPYITSSSFNFNGQRQDIANLDCPNISLVQQLGNFQCAAINDQWSFINQSPHLSDQNNKEEIISKHYLKFSETSNSSNSSSTVDDFQFPSSKNEPTNNLHDLTEKLLLNTLSSGFQINGNDQIKVAEFYPNSHNFSEIYPSIDISCWNQSSPARYEDGFNHSIPEKMQESRLFCGGNKMSSMRMGNPITEAKRASTFMNMKTAPTSLKKTRVEPRASCPPFKVRKEKLGDRISALQQLVAPFGKSSHKRRRGGDLTRERKRRWLRDNSDKFSDTDTASVLMEAIGYIKFLQNQVETLSVPYMKPLCNKTRRGVHGVQLEYGNEEPRRDLKSLGLCLVPLACMSYLTGDNGCYGGGILPPPFG